MEKKDHLERDDMKFLKMASYVERVSKKICKASNIFKFNIGCESAGIDREVSSISLGRTNTDVNESRVKKI